MRRRPAGITLATALVLLAACGDGGGFPDAPVMMPPQNPGTIAVTWKLVDSLQQPTTCTAANAARVVVNIVQEGTAAQFGQTFPCSLGTAVSGSLATATYDLSFSLDDGSGSVITTAMPQTGIAVTPDQTTDVGQIVFTVPAS